MDRRNFIQLSATGGILGAAASSTPTANADDGTTSLAHGHPVAMAPRSDGIEIVWRTNSLAKGYVEYGLSEQLGEQARNDGWGLRPAGEEAIRVALRGLQPGTRYFYRVVTENFATKDPTVEHGEIRNFKTLDSTAKTTNFSVWNDTHKNTETIKKLAELTGKSDFLLWNGDISNDWNKEGDVPQSILTPGNGVDFTAQSPLLVLRGNHDLRGTLAHQVEDVAATPSGKPWYAVRSGPVAAICLDTGEDKPDDHAYLFGRVACEPMRREQAEWLKEVTQQPEFKNAPYRIIFCHIPLRWRDEETQHSYDHFSRRSRDQWHDSLVEWGAQLVVSGHTHSDEFIPANEAFSYAQLVGGGPKPAQARLIRGEANAESLGVTMTNLQGEQTRKHSFRPLV